MQRERQPGIADLGFDPSTETWYADLRSDRRLDLTRENLAHLVRLYNRIHRGDPLYLFDHARLNRLHHHNDRLSRSVRDLYLFIDREREERLANRLRRWMSRLLRRSPARCRS